MTSICCVLLLLWAVDGRAQSAPAEEPTPAGPPSEAAVPDPQPRLDLERLLRIPPDGVTTPDQKGGKDRATWQSEFAEAHGEVRELEVRIAETKKNCTDDGWHAVQELAYLGEDDRMFECLNEAVQRKRTPPPYFSKVWPAYDPYRDDPRFTALLRRMNLEE